MSKKKEGIIDQPTAMDMTAMAITALILRDGKPVVFKLAEFDLIEKVKSRGLGITVDPVTQTITFSIE